MDLRRECQQLPTPTHSNHEKQLLPSLQSPIHLLTMVATSFITALALAGAIAAAPAGGSYSPKPGDLPASLKVVDTDLCLDNAHGITDIGNPINGWYCGGPDKKKQGWFRENGKLRLAGVEDRCIGGKLMARFVQHAILTSSEQAGSPRTRLVHQERPRDQDRHVWLRTSQRAALDSG